MFIDEFINYLTKNIHAYIQAIAENCALSLVSLIAALLIAVPMGVLCAKNSKISNSIIGIFTFLRLIPGIALLILFMPILKTGFLPTCIALTLLACPPVCINTYAGITGVNEFIIESAIGMGLDRRQIFFKVELPLAMPMIIVGIRTAAIEVISSSTLAALMGAGGLGRYIFSGMQMNNAVMLVLGGATIALLALFAEFFLSLLQRRYNRFI